MKLCKIITLFFAIFVLMLIATYNGNINSDNGYINLESTAVKTTETDIKQDSIKDLLLTEIGLPYGSLESYIARMPWDIKIFDGYLYVGAGDYGENVSPEFARRYNLATKTWEECGAIPDEQIGKFVIIDGKLVITGTDPIDDWSMGNYYVLTGNSFVMRRIIPGGIHNFDMVEFEGKIFAGLGVESSFYPVQVSYDKGGTFAQVSFEKDGAPLDTSGITSVRAYDLVVSNYSLYAIIYLDGSTREVYKYENGLFVYLNNWAEDIFLGSIAQVAYASKAVYYDSVYFTNAKLYTTKDMNNIELVSFDEAKTITDILVYDNRLLVMGYKVLEDGNYQNYIYEKIDDDDFRLIAQFQSEIAAYSFEYFSGSFWLGFGIRNKDNINTGVIAEAKYDFSNIN